MELHIYREGTADRLVKNESKDSVLYYIESPHKWTSFPPKRVYRGELPKAPQIATINRNGYFKPTYTITFPGLAEVVINSPSTFGRKSKFSFGGREYAWDSDKELIETSTGKALARFDRKAFAMKKKGVLSIYGEGMEMVDVILTTGIAMQYRWEERRRNNMAAASG